LGQLGHWFRTRCGSCRVGSDFWWVGSGPKKVTRVPLWVGVSPSPRTKVKKLLRGRKVATDIRKKLEYGECVEKQLKQNASLTTNYEKQKQMFTWSVSGSILNSSVSWKCTNALANSTFCLYIVFSYQLPRNGVDVKRRRGWDAIWSQRVVIPL